MTLAKPKYNNYNNFCPMLSILEIKVMIEDREYMKRELSRIYSPHTREVKSAMKRLREDINGCPELVEALKQTRWNRNRNAYTARQVRLIAEYLCID